MYAVIKTGGKQHKVRAGDVIEVEKLVHGDETVTFQPLMVVDDDGTTHVGKDVAKATVTAKPLGETKGDKVKIFKYRPKTGYAKRGGHRQQLTLLEIEDVSIGGAPKKKATAKKKAAPKDEEAAAAETEAQTEGATPAGEAEAAPTTEVEAAPAAEAEASPRSDD